MKRTKKYKRLNRKKSRKQRGGSQALIRAVENGNIEEVENIIRNLNIRNKEAIARVINERELIDERDGVTPIILATSMIFAIALGKQDIASLLLENGGTLTERDLIDLLMIALRDCNEVAVIDTIEIFKERFDSASFERRINKKYERGFTPLDAFIAFRDPEMEDNIKQRRAKIISNIILILILNGAIVEQSVPPSEEDYSRISKIWEIAIIARNVALVSLLTERDYGVGEEVFSYVLDSYDDDKENVDVKKIIRLIASKLFEKGLIPKASGEATKREILELPEEDVHPYDNPDFINYEEIEDRDAIPGAYHREGVVLREALRAIPNAEPVVDGNIPHNVAGRAVLGSVSYGRIDDNQQPIQQALPFGGKKTRRRR